MFFLYTSRTEPAGALYSGVNLQSTAIIRDAWFELCTEPNQIISCRGCHCLFQTEKLSYAFLAVFLSSLCDLTLFVTVFLSSLCVI